MDAVRMQQTSTVPDVRRRLRVDFLDGLRGWAALVVVLTHTMQNFLAGTTPQYYDRTLYFINDSHLAVLVFFVLSGYVLSLSQFSIDRRHLALSATSRYFRLAIPISVNTMIVYAMWRAGLFFNIQVAVTPETSQGWLGTFYKFDNSIFSAVKFAVYDVFFAYNGFATYNSSLWTMVWEISGSFLIYAYVGIFRSSVKVYWLIGMATTGYLLYQSPLMACFMFGYLVAELDTAWRPRRGTWTAIAVEILTLTGFATVVMISTYLRPSPSDDWKTCLEATLLVLCVSYSTPMRWFFTNGVSHFLGRISFPLYLIQIPIICSVSSYLFMKLPELGITGLIRSNLVLGSTVVACLIAARLLLPVEDFSTRASKRVASALLTGWSDPAFPTKLLLLPGRFRAYNAARDEVDVARSP